MKPRQTDGATERRVSGRASSAIALTDVGALMRGLNADDLEQMERVLIEADFGVPATVELTQALEDEVRRGKLKTEADLQRRARERLGDDARRAPSDPGVIARAEPGPTVILLVGVNGTGKTTTAAKLAPAAPARGPDGAARGGRHLPRRRHRPAPGLGRPARHRPAWPATPGGDPASVAFDAIDAAVSRGLDTVIIDTAGRLHTQEGLMEELRKVVRVDRPAAAGRAARDPARARRHRGPERRPAGQALLRRRSRPPGSWSPSSTAAPGAARWRRSGASSACRSVSSGWAKGSTISSRSMPSASRRLLAETPVEAS